MTVSLEQVKTLVLPVQVSIKMHYDIFSDRKNPLRERGGLIEGTINGTVATCVEYHPVPNIAKNTPEDMDNFRMNPLVSSKVLTDINSRSAISIGFLHTHNYWAGYPSRHDTAMAKQIDEDLIWLIYGFKDHNYLAWNWDNKKSKFIELQFVLDSTKGITHGHLS